MSYLSDPIQRMQSRIDHYSETFDGKCQGCGEPGEDFDCGLMGDGPALCSYCSGFETRPDPKESR